MVEAVKFHVYTVFPSGLNLQLFLKDLIKLTTLARKTKNTVVKVKLALQGNRVYDTVYINIVLKN